MLRVALLAVWLLMASSTFAAEPAFKRWAVLAQESLRESGVSDLLMAELAAKSVELVEREQLDAVAKEVELSKLLGNDSAALRLKVGQIAKADALVLLSMIEKEKQAKFVRLVVCDCRYGARLRLEHWPLPKGTPDKLAEEIAAAVIQTQTKFTRGVSRLVAVSPLLSKNLSHDFDHMQFGLAAVLGETLSQRPGIAVLEIEEARSISDELGKTGMQLEGRRVPVFVEGEFEVVTKSKPEERTIKLQLRASDGKDRVTEAKHEALGNAAAVQWLSDEFAPRLLAKHVEGQGGNSVPSLSLTEQRERLIARADAFSAVSAFLQAAALREAALLMDGSHVEQRVLLVRDYGEAVLGQMTGLAETSPPLSIAVKMERNRAYRETMVPKLRSLWFPLLAHLDQLTAGNDLNPNEMAVLLEHVTRRYAHMLLSDALEIGLYDSWKSLHWRMIESLSRRDPVLRKGGLNAAVRELNPLADAREATPIEVSEKWLDQAIAQVLSWLPVRFEAGNRMRFEDAQTLHRLDLLITRHCRSDFVSPRLLWQLLDKAGPLTTFAEAKRVPESELVEMLKRWSKDEREIISIYGRTALVGLKLSDSIREPVNESDVMVLNLFEVQLARRKSVPSKPSTELGLLEKSLFATKKSVTDIRVREMIPATARKPIATVRGSDPQRVQFEPLDVIANWTALRRCSDDLDLAWGQLNVTLIEAGPRYVEVIPVDRRPQAFAKPDSIYVAGWDGQHIWVASSVSGVQVFDRQGKRLAQFVPGKTDTKSSISLPPVLQSSATIGGVNAGACTTPLWVYPLGLGRCFVKGVSHYDGRCWMGCLERHSDAVEEWRFSMWLESKRQDSSTKTDDLVDVAIRPTSFLDYRSAATGERWLLLGRPSRNFRETREPLCFDVATGKASIFPHAVGSGLNGWTNLVQDDVGAIVNPEPLWATRWEQLPNGSFKSRKLIEPTPLPVTPPDSWVSKSYPSDRPELVRSGSWLYWPGIKWRRIDAKTGNVEVIEPQPLAYRYDFECYADSAHFGFVAWNCGSPLHRVHVDQPKNSEQEADWLYPFVPATERRKHHQAVLAIRQLGGEVDVRMPRMASPVGILHDPVWQVSVLLTKTWQGGDEGLRHLLDLHSLCDVTIAGSPITDVGMRTVKTVATLRTLNLVRTKVTNQGLVGLGQLAELREVWLEPEAGTATLTDDALADMLDAKKLARATLVGRGFTDGALTHLMKLKGPSSAVRLIKTDVTPTGIAAFKKQRPTTQFLSETGQ